ncbi:MAG TPA: hypothetical protein VI386_37915 [Candidatus Sulfotelmatobacter sp.]
MTAKLARVEDRIVAGVEEASAVRDGSVIPRSASDKPPVGGMQFAALTLRPYIACRETLSWRIDETQRIYTANYDDNTVSVISAP